MNFTLWARNVAKRDILKVSAVHGPYLPLGKVRANHQESMADWQRIRQQTIYYNLTVFMRTFG